MRPALNLIASVLLGWAGVIALMSPGRFNPLLDDAVACATTGVVAPPVGSGEARDVSLNEHWEPIGLSLLHPYVRGKIPVVLIHGLGATPDSWDFFVRRLQTIPPIRDHYQIWTFGYASGQPILYSASLLRRALLQARAQYDPERTDRAFDGMVLVGYSMGGILAKAMALDSQSVLWDQISDQPVGKLLGPARARDALVQSFFFKAVPEVHRIIFIATPHRGSRVDSGALHWLGVQLNQPLDPLRTFHAALVASNEPDFFRESFRQGLSSSVDQLAWGHPRLMALFDLPRNPDVKFHSIIPDVDDPPAPGGTDGVVSYASAHLDGVSSERIVHAGHLCLANPDVIRECERILIENLKEFGSGAGGSVPRSIAAARPPDDQSWKLKILFHHRTSHQARV